MPSPPIREAVTFDWTYEDVAGELESLARLEDLELPSGPSLSDLPSLVLGDELAHVAEDLETVAELEAR
jgi:hypothetical protein